MKNLKLNYKLGLAFGVVLVSMVLVGVMSQRSLGFVRRGADGIILDNLPGVTNAERMYGNAVVNIGNMRALTLANDPKVRGSIEADMKEITRKNEEAYKKYEEAIFAAEDRALFNKAVDKKAIWIAERGKVTTLLEQGKQTEATALLQDLQGTAVADYLGAITELVTFNERHAKDGGDTIRSAITAPGPEMDEHEARFPKHCRQLDDLATAVRSGASETSVAPHAGRRALEVILGIYQSAETGRPYRFSRS